MASPALQKMTASELRGSIERMKTRARNLAEKAQHPVKQGGFGVAAVAGGATGGLVAGMKPEFLGVPTDAIAGAAVALPCLLGAGNTAVDALAIGGWGMLAGSASRLTFNGTRNWREQRAADDGEALAKQIVAAQKALDALRVKRDNPAKESA